MSLAQEGSVMPLVRFVNCVFAWLDKKLSKWFLSSLARLYFAGILLVYYLNSAQTKFGDGLFSFSAGAYVQIFPKTMESVGYNQAELGFFYDLVVFMGTYAEIILPLLIVVGLLTRLAAVGMIGFVIVQSIVDITGHGLAGKDVGGWFDGPPDAIIFDQRALWVFLLIVIFLKGAGPISVDRLLMKRKLLPSSF